MSTVTASPFATTSKPAGGDYERCKKGTLSAVIFGLIDLGTHAVTYPGKDGKPPRTADVRKGALLIQISKKLRSQANGEPFIFVEEFSMGSSPAARMRQLYESVMETKLDDNVRFDPMQLVGRSCTASIIDSKTAKGKEYSKLDSVTSLAEGMEDVEVAVPDLPHKAENGKPCLFWFHGVEDMGDFPSHAWLPWSFGKPLFETYRESHEYRKAHGITESTITTPNFVEAKVIFESTMVANGHELWTLLSRIDRECRTKLVDEAVSFCEAMKWSPRLSDLNEADANTVYGNVRRTLVKDAGPTTEELQEVF
jgi:hypothetical protein